VKTRTVSQQELKTIVHYDPETGLFTWLSNRGGKAFAGSVAGSVNRRGYVELTIACRKWLAHRLAWYYMHGAVPVAVDHINGNRQDNRLENLREVTRSENQCNRGVLANNTSGYAGVSWHKKSKAWVVRLMKNGKSHMIGYFKDLELAGLVASEARSLYHGTFAKV